MCARAAANGSVRRARFVQWPNGGGHCEIIDQGPWRRAVRAKKWSNASPYLMASPPSRLIFILFESFGLRFARHRRTALPPTHLPRTARAHITGNHTQRGPPSSPDEPRFAASAISTRGTK
jgi:hypothetical protein